jgi:xanthine dehydrogenase accessory factor
MKIETLKEIIKKKSSNERFAILTNLSDGSSEMFKLGTPISKNFINYKNEIENYYNLNKNGIINNTEIFVQNYIKPVEVIIIGAVHITQYLIGFLKDLNFDVTVIDPREYFVTKQNFQNIKIINKWPEEFFNKIQTSSNTALITLTHDPKIDEPALKHALKQKFFYIGALGSKKTHEKRCKRLQEDGFNDEEIGSIHGPIGIKLGGKSASEIALSIVAQLVFETNKHKTT